MTIRLERIDNEDGRTEFRIAVGESDADAWETALSALVGLANGSRPPLRKASPEDNAARELPGKLLKRLRTECRMTQKEAAAIAGTTQTRISDFECGVRTIPHEIAVIFARRFGVEPGDFKVR